MLKFFSLGGQGPKEAEEKHTRSLLEQECWNPPPFGTQSIRVLVCQNSENNPMEMVLFDSHQIIGPDLGGTNEPSSVSSTASSFYSNPSPAKSSFRSSSVSSLLGSFLGDRSTASNTASSASSTTMPARRHTRVVPPIFSKLMFGVTPLAYKGPTTKIHLLQDPSQVMLTKTFTIHPNDVVAFSNTAPTRRGSFSSSTSTSTANGDLSGMSTISGIGDFRSMSRSARPIPTFIPEQGPLLAHDGRGASPPSFSSSMPSSFIMRSSRSSRPSFSSRRQRRASQTSMENGPALTQAARSKSYSIAVIIDVKDNMRLREFIFSHFALIEARLHHLQALCMEVLLPICRHALYSSKGSHRVIPNFSKAEFQRDNRIFEATARFQQSLYELYSAPRIQNNAQGSYDPLWAQLSDLYGNIGTVSSASRTIVVGTQASFVRRLLYILSYFIRCNEVFQRIIELDDDPESLLKPRPPRASMELREEEETGSPASLMRSISIPKRPSRIETMPIRGSVSSSRMTNLDVPTTPIQPQHPRGSYLDRSSGFGASGTAATAASTATATTTTQATVVAGGAVNRRPLIDTQRPRIDTRDGLSTSSTPQHSGPTTPTTIGSRGESDRISTGEDSTGGGHAGVGGSGGAIRPLLAVDTRYGRSQSTETLDSQFSGRRSAGGHVSGAGAPGSTDGDSQDSTLQVPMPSVTVVQTFPPFPTIPAAAINGDESAKRANGNDDGTLVPTATQPSSQQGSSALLSSSQPQQQQPLPPLPQQQPSQHQAQSSTSSQTQQQLQQLAGAVSATPASLPADTLFCKSYGRSLMAPYCDHYLPDFALMGVPRCDFLDPMEADMKDMMRHFEIQERITSTVCIVADANTWKCNVFSAKSEFDRPEVVSMQNSSTSAFVDATLQRMVELFNNGLPADSCLTYLEDRLGQLYQHSKMLMEMTSHKETAESLFSNLDSVASTLGVHRSDLSLLASVCATYDDSILAFFPDVI
ncbi:Folliculin-interacting protein 1 [Actinomortierella ambigua]|uniref:Folliculin-interacting protein 1 n=1 Tax=Actinomortierella ambigua TaxID=1343610 RepID=A0A9P6PZE4_9FUNG|nr:Folliculin-interacting protein 1 [Actinomortierella ambigua]